MRVCWAVLLGALSACTNTTPTGGAGSGQCARRDLSTYAVTYSGTSAPCGLGGASTASIVAQPALVDAPCFGKISYSPDNCDVTYQSTCPDDSVTKGGKLSVTGFAQWTFDGASGTSMESRSLINADGGLICQDTYDVTAVRQ